MVAIALATKCSGILALPMLGIALFCRVLIARPWPVFRWTLSTRLQRLAAALAILFGALVVGYAGIWASYGFRFGPTGDPQERFDFHSPNYNCGIGEMLLRQDNPPLYPTNATLHEWVGKEWKPSLVVRAANAANRNRLFPQAWLFGFLYTYGTSMARRTFLCGEIGIVGWWYYFPAAMAFKTPLATLAGLGSAAAIWLMNTPAGKIPVEMPIEIHGQPAPVIVCPVFYMAVAMRSHLNIGLRHIFPVYPFLFVFLGVIAAQCFARHPKITCWIVSLLFLGLACETWSAYPNYLPFFNVAAGGCAVAWRCSAIPTSIGARTSPHWSNGKASTRIGSFIFAALDFPIRAITTSTTSKCPEANLPSPMKPFRPAFPPSTPSAPSLCRERI